MKDFIIPDRDFGTPAAKSKQMVTLTIDGFAVTVPEGADEAGVRKQLLTDFSIEIGAGLGPMKGKIWRIGLMGATSTPDNVKKVLGALRICLWK